MKGWLLDIYPDHSDDSIVYWVKTRRGARRIVDRAFVPKIYAHSTPEKMDELERDLHILDAVGKVERDMKSTWLGEEPREVLAVSVCRYSKVEDVAHTIDNRGRYRDFSLYNVDLRFSQRYLSEKGVFPMGLLELRPKPVMMDDQFAMDYEQPPLSGAVLKVSPGGRKGLPTFKDRLVSAAVDGDVVDGPEEDVLRGIQELLASKDPDVLYTDGGDVFALPYLFCRAKGLGLDGFSLGRDRDDTDTDRKGKSYFSYGQIKYKPPSYSLRGRVHIDRTSSFMFSESGLHGLTDLSRISGIPLQEMARLSPGTAISAMEVNQALKDGCIVLWKKNVPEGFKTAEELVVADRGGFIYEPRVGIHDRVLEVDFTSLYPNIMARFNISPETIMCGCCPEPSRRVPVLGYGICDRRLGLIPRVLKPVVDRRTRLKRMVRAGIGDTKSYEERVKILKWLLVTCLDEGTEVPLLKDGRFDVLPVEEIVDGYARVGCGEFPVDDGLQLFGVDAGLVPSLKRAVKAFRFPAPERMVELRLADGRLRLTPDHPCFVSEGGRLTVRPAARLRRGDRLPGLLPLYDGRARGGRYISDIIIKSTHMIKPSGDHVYCLGVDGPLRGFALANGVLTHNCFGYTGYKNARFGRIECHEAINAYGRELMLQASEIAEAHGFEILHGIVDSLWLKGNGDPERFCEHVSGHTGIPLEPEGIYDWIVFLPDRSHGVGVLNRYYGKFQGGKLKVRGIELRRRDGTGLVKDMQQEMLAHFSKASDAQQFIELIPSALDIVDRYVQAVRSRTVPLDKLLVTKMVSKALGEYSQFNDNVAALTQLEDEGASVNPGEAVRYVVLDSSSRNPARRVAVEQLLTGCEEYDPEAYVDLVLRGAESILLPFGYSFERLAGTFSDNAVSGKLRGLF